MRLKLTIEYVGDLIVKNIAIILKQMEEDEVFTFVKELTKGLLKLGGVFIFALDRTGRVFCEGVRTVDVGVTSDYYEYNIGYYKKKYGIDYSISIGDMMNAANVRTSQRDETTILVEHTLCNGALIKERVRRDRYYKYADKIITIENYSDENKITDILDFVERPKRKHDVQDEELNIDVQLLQNRDSIYIYGAGLLGRAFYLRNKGLRDRIRGFVVTKKSSRETELFGIPVVEMASVAPAAESSVFVIAVCEKYIDEVLGTLFDYGCINICFPYYAAPFCYEYYKNNSENINEKEELLNLYSYYTGKTMDLDRVQTYNEKLQWMKYYDKSDKSAYTDKYLVRKYIREKIGEGYLVPCLGVWEKYDDIDFGSLPDRFVLKCTHASGYNVIVKNKNSLDHEKNRILFEKWLSIEYKHVAFANEYEGIYPRIIAEKMLEDETGELKDYKVFVFGGKARMIQVDIDRSTNHKRNLYTTDWEYIPCSILYPTAPNINVEKPKMLPELIEISEKISEGFAHVRTDFYICNDKIFFGEMTFRHGGGYEPFDPEGFGLEMGSWLKVGKEA